MVPGLRDFPRIDCICHRLHTVFTDAYKETQRQVPEVKKYEEAAATLCKYVKQATGIQETLPVSIKHGGTTRPWTSIYRSVHSIHESYTKLSEKLTERVKLPLLAAVDKELNEQIRDVTEVFNGVFENLQYNTRPTINLVIPSYYKLSAMATHEDQDSLEIATLKQNIHSLLDEKLYSSITQFHWIATIFYPGFKSLSFLPDSTPADRKFKRDLLKDLPGWIEILAQTNSGTIQLTVNVSCPRIHCRGRNRRTPSKEEEIVLWFNAQQHPTCNAHWGCNAQLAARVRYVY